MIFKSKQLSLSYFKNYFYLALLIFLTFALASASNATSKTIPNEGSVDRIARSLAIISRSYYAPSRIQPGKMLQEGLNALANKIPELLIENDTSSAKGQLKITLAGQINNIKFDEPANLEDILPIANDVFNFIAQNYKGDIEHADQEYAFISGLLKTLDPHSNILPPKVFEEFKTQTAGEYGGIGIVVGIKEDDLTVIAPLEGTPAAKLGIITDDKITEIDHQPTINMPLSEAVDKLRGKVGTKVTLLLNRKNKDPFEVTITRQVINIESVRSKLITENGKRFGILSIRSFQEETYLEVHKALVNMMATGPLNGLILDLRNNPGGLLDQSLEIADRFLSRGDILYTVGEANAEEDVAVAHLDAEDITNVPLITLIDQGSASASEIVAGALKNNERSLLIGSQTFGKGSVQSLFSLRDGSSIKLTIAQYLTPGRVSIQAVGVTPDIEFTPSLVSEEDLDILNDNGETGEKNLEEHLENEQYIKKQKPVFGLRYLQEVKKDQAKESEYTVKIDEKSDYLLGIGLEILRKTKGATRLDLLTQALPIMALEATKQDQILTSALEKRQINWSQKHSKINSEITLGVESVFINKKTALMTQSLNAGEEIEWQLTVSNPLDQDLTRVVGVVSAENPFLNYREFIFGRVPAKGKAAAKIKLKIPEETLSVSENTVLRFLSEQSQTVKDSLIPVAITEKQRPSLAYSIQVKDDGSHGSSGNANGRPEKGEKLAVLVNLSNKGTAAIDTGYINLKNLDGAGIFLREGRATINNLNPGNETTARLLLQIDKTFEKNETKLELSFIDKTTKTGFTDNIAFDFLATPNIKPAPGELQVLPEIEISNQSSRDQILSLSGKASDDRNLKDIIIYTNGRKIYYHANAAQQSKLDFSSNIKLDKGLNIITIEARDNRNLSRKQNIIVMGERKPLEPLKTGLLW